jgi:hypothetical protein
MKKEGKETTNKIKTEKNHVNLILMLKNVTVCGPRQWRQKLMWSFCLPKYINNEKKGKIHFTALNYPPICTFNPSV